METTDLKAIQSKYERIVAKILDVLEFDVSIETKDEEVVKLKVHKVGPTNLNTLNDLHGFFDDDFPICSIKRSGFGITITFSK